MDSTQINNSNTLEALDCISRQAAIDALMVAIADVGVLDGDDIKVVFDNLPSAQPTQEIIHCKDCKRFRKPSSIVNADWGWCSGWPTPLTTFVKVDGFCHRAEKRVEAE